MARSIIIAIAALHPVTSFAQLELLTQFENKIALRIDLEMSADEVKQVLGSPKGIEAGLPKMETSIVSELPERVDRPNKSTWIYFYDVIILNEDEFQRGEYKINGFQVSEDVYDDYLNVVEIFVHDGEVVSPATGRGYQFLRDPSLKIVPKDSQTTFARSPKIIQVTKAYLPIYCVTFDNASQVVVETNMFFKIARR